MFSILTCATSKLFKMICLSSIIFQTLKRFEISAETLFNSHVGSEIECDSLNQRELEQYALFCCF